MDSISHDYNACQPKRPDAKTYYRYSAFIAISRCPAGSEGKPIQDQRKENGNAEARPLARGEHSDRTTQNDLQQGSSPLARGPHGAVPVDSDRPRLIPARAGNTASCAVKSLAVRAHPRSRGEHEYPGGGWYLDKGSSPLARGTQLPTLWCVLCCGLIPARAGNTIATSCLKRARRAHPRSRGEHNLSRRLWTLRRGSSPLARGTRQITGAVTDVRGLIPARAGNTDSSSNRSISSWAHPRSRGDHRQIPHPKSSGVGSSPLARGPPWRYRGVLYDPGLIPARAGTTL